MVQFLSCGQRSHPVQAFIEPDLEKAHIRIVNSFNPFSGLLNPIYTLKSANVTFPLLCIFALAFF